MGRNSIGLEIGAHSAKMTVVTFESARTGRIRLTLKVGTKIWRNNSLT